MVSGCGVIEEGTARIEGSENGSNVRLRERQRGFDDCVATDVWLRSRGPSGTFMKAKPQGRIERPVWRKHQIRIPTLLEIRP